MFPGELGRSVPVGTPANNGPSVRRGLRPSPAAVLAESGPRSRCPLAPGAVGPNRRRSGPRRGGIDAARRRPTRRYAARAMDLRRLRAGEWIAALSGVALLVSLFLPWYGDGPADEASGWQALAAVDIALALVAAFGVSLLVITASQRVPAVPIALSAIVMLVGLIGVLLALIRLANVPGGFDDRELGVWLGLLAAIGIVAGAALAMRDERLSPDGRPTDLTGRPTPAPPEIERIPAPPPQ
jgi:hypothetical protein